MNNAPSWDRMETEMTHVLRCPVKQTIWFSMVKKDHPNFLVGDFSSIYGTTPAVLNKQLLVARESSNSIMPRDIYSTDVLNNLYLCENAHKVYVFRGAKQTFRDHNFHVWSVLGGKNHISFQKVLEYDPPIPCEDCERPFDQYPEYLMLGGADAIETMLKMSMDFNTAYTLRSGYKGDYRFKYMICDSWTFALPMIVWGPEFPWVHDSDIIRRMGIANMMRHNNYLLKCDSKFSTWDFCLTPLDFDLRGEKKRFCGSRSSTEHLNSKFMKWNILSTRFRHDLKWHTNVFQMIANTVYWECLESPIRGV